MQSKSAVLVPDIPQESFESVLREKLAMLSRVEREPSSIRYSMTRDGDNYSGILLVESSRGKFFATAVTDGFNELTNMLLKQIMKQITPPSFETTSISLAH